MIAGSSDGVVRLYRNYDPIYGDGTQLELVSGWKALRSIVRPTRAAGIVTEWSQNTARLLCAGDSQFIYDWDATTERCVAVRIKSPDTLDG